MIAIGGTMLAPGGARDEGARTVAAMAARVAGAGPPTAVVVDAMAMFAAGGGRVAQMPNGTVVCADLEVVNLDELAAQEPDRDPLSVVAALYGRHGLAGIRQLHGGFAVAVWDPRDRRLHLAVDHHGIKRLYYVRGTHGLAFASRAIALLAVPGVDAAVDPTAIYEHLNFGFVPAPGSIFAGVHRLAPGHELTGPPDRPTVAPYWDPVFAESRIHPDEAALETYRLAQEAVERCARGASGKEAGAFLSGGTDSSTVVGLMGKASGERINAFSVGFRETRYDELGYAELVARHFGAAHHTVVVGPDHAFAALPGLVEAYDEPFANSSALGTLFCAQLARECGVTRLLAGDGGDEIFGGNERYARDRVFGVYHRLPRLLRRGLLEPLLDRLPADAPGILGRAQRYTRRARLDNPARFYFSEFFFAHEADALLGDFLVAVDRDAPWRVLREHFRRAQATSELNRLLYVDLKLTIGDNDLLKVTRTAELAGVAVRFPFLDLPLVELWAGLPARFKVRRLEKRYLFKRAFRNLLPAEVLAKRKHGFGVPTGWWVKTEPTFHAFARETLLSRRSLDRGYIRREGIERLFGLLAADETPYYGDLLWNMLMLELWAQRHVDGRSSA
jgi:asparagine synthase (glutamine-hydrolysing)